MRDWQVVRLEDVADIRISNVDKKSVASERPVRLCNYMDVYGNDYIDGRLAFMEATASQAEIERFKVQCGDILITKDSETPDDIGIPAVITEDVQGLVAGYHLALIRPRRDWVDSVYLAKQLSAERAVRHFSRRAAGSTRYGLSTSTIASTPILVAPLPMQRRIAEILTTLDEAIGQTESAIFKKKSIASGLFCDLLCRGLSSNAGLRDTFAAAPDLYQQDHIGPVPKSWQVCKLRDLALPGRSHVKTGPFGSSLKIEHWRDEGHPVITIGSLGEGRIDTEHLLFVSAGTAQRLREFQLEIGDVVFSRVADVGRSVVIRDDQNKWIMSSNLMRISIDKNKILPDFLQFLLAHDARVRTQIRRKVNAGGRDVANSKILNELRFPVPPVSEQNAIVERLHAHGREYEIDLQAAAALHAIRCGLTSDLLSGRIRVSA